MSSVSDQAFLVLVKSFSKEQLRNYLTDVYEHLAKQHGERIGFGKDGAREFADALILMRFDPATVDSITFALTQVFKKSWGPLDFSDFMDKVVNEKSIISYPAWSEAWRHLRDHHSWINEHPCSTGRTTLSSTNPMKNILQRIDNEGRYNHIPAELTIQQQIIDAKAFQTLSQVNDALSSPPTSKTQEQLRNDNLADDHSLDDKKSDQLRALELLDQGKITFEQCLTLLQEIQKQKDDTWKG